VSLPSGSSLWRLLLGISFGALTADLVSASPSAERRGAECSASLCGGVAQLTSQVCHLPPLKSKNTQSEETMSTLKALKNPSEPLVESGAGEES
ncbi:unnamed protein product, partial [Durusdinium trenchii]